MAIDDNEDYTLTGAQVKDLAQRIQSGGGASYTAGNGIDITNNEISVDNTEVPFLTDLAAVATSGSYSDLSGTPTIPTQFSDLSGTVGTSQIADGAVTAPKLDFSTMYVAAPDATSNISVPNGGAIIQSLTLPAGKWRVFAQFRVAIGSMGANVTKFFYVGFKNGSTMSGTTINEIPVNLTADSSGSGRLLVSMTSKEITSTGGYVVGSYALFNNITTDSQIIYNAPGIYLYAFRVG